MSEQRNLRTYTKAIQAGQEIVIEVAGNMFHVLKSDGRFTVEFDESNRLEEVPEGASSVFSSAYQRVKLKSALTQIITIVLGFGQFTTSNTTAVANVNATINVANNTQFLSASVDAQAQIQAVDTQRKEIIISVPSNATNGIRITDITTANREIGFLVEEGQSVTISGISQIRAASAVAGVTVAFTYILQKAV
jgi:hypothetical protein